MGEQRSTEWRAVESPDGSWWLWRGDPIVDAGDGDTEWSTVCMLDMMPHSAAIRVLVEADERCMHLSPADGGQCLEPESSLLHPTAHAFQPETTLAAAERMVGLARKCIRFVLQLVEITNTTNGYDAIKVVREMASQVMTDESIERVASSLAKGLGDDRRYFHVFRDAIKQARGTKQPLGEMIREELNRG